MCGITPFHVRVLCDNPWDGGRGYTPQEVGDMTLDNIYLLLTDRKLLRAGNKARTVSMDALGATSLANKDGLIKGRTADGQQFYAKIGGQSLASRLIAAEKEKTTKQKRRERRRNQTS